jgi:hypothetical protein
MKLAMRIRARAIRRCGELRKTFNKGDGRPSGNYAAADIVSQRQAAEEAGLSRRQEVQAVRVANVPLVDWNRRRWSCP